MIFASFCSMKKETKKINKKQLTTLFTLKIQIYPPLNPSEYKTDNKTPSQGKILFHNSSIDLSFTSFFFYMLSSLPQTSFLEYKYTRYIYIYMYNEKYRIFEKNCQIRDLFNSTRLGLRINE